MGCNVSSNVLTQRDNYYHVIIVFFQLGRCVSPCLCLHGFAQVQKNSRSNPFLCPFPMTFPIPMVMVARRATITDNPHLQLNEIAQIREQMMTRQKQSCPSSQLSEHLLLLCLPLLDLWRSLLDPSLLFDFQDFDALANRLRRGRQCLVHRYRQIRPASCRYEG